MENIEKNPPKKYSLTHLEEIDEALAKTLQKVRVVTYNILFDLFDDELEDQACSWPLRLPRVIESIENMQPDILCVQEPYPAQLKDLQKQLGDRFDCFVGDSTTGELNAVFFDKERFELDTEAASASLALPLNSHDEALVAQIPNFLPPELEPGRQLTLVHLREKSTGKSFAVINTHLTYYRINSREDQAHFIAGLVRNLHKTVIFAGDLNTFPNWPNHAQFRYLDGDRIGQIFQTVLKDTKDTALLGHVGPLSTFTKDFFKPNCKPFEETGTAGVVLDHIYVSPDVTVIINATEPSKVDCRYPSDHMPVIADILLP